MNGPDLGPDDLVLCAGTLAATPPLERADAAAAAGFRGVSLFVSDVERARADGLSPADLARALADRGLAVAELDPLLRWVPGAELGASATDMGRAFFAWGVEAFLDVAAGVGARSVNAVCASEDPLDPELLAQAFAAVCDRAAERGLLVHLEALPWSAVPSTRAALDVVERAGRPASGITLDVWHHFRGGGDAGAVAALPAERVLAVQLSDAPARPEADPVAETLHRRRLPGEGELDLAGVLRALRAQGAPAPLGVEVFSDALAALAPAEVARRAADAVRALRAAAEEAR